MCLAVLLSWCVQCLEQLQSRYSQVSLLPLAYRTLGMDWNTLVFWFAGHSSSRYVALAIEQSEISGFKGDLIDFHSQV